MHLKVYALFSSLPHIFLSVYDPNKMIISVLQSEVPDMLPAKYQGNWSSGSGEEVVTMVFTIYGHD